MVVGENQRPTDLVINVCKKRHVTNVRSSIREIDERLTPPREMSLDQAIEYVRDDELLEVTPKSLRIRKRILDARTRGRCRPRSESGLFNSPPQLEGFLNHPGSRQVPFAHPRLPPRMAGYPPESSSLRANRNSKIQGAP